MTTRRQSQTPRSQTAPPDQLRAAGPRSAALDKQTVAHAYDRSAAGFAAAADRYVYRYLADPLADALAGVEGPVLDVAAGTGAAGRLFADHVAIDLSMGQLRENTGPHRVRADAEHLPFRAGSFAAAVCAFGINHFPNADVSMAEMARVAPVVALTTWRFPATPYVPKQVVMGVLARQGQPSRSALGTLVDSLGGRVGTRSALGALLSGAGLRPEVEERTVVVPWPGIEAFLDYRLSMASTPAVTVGAAALRDAAASALAAVADHDLEWRAEIVVGVGRRGRS